MKKKLVIVALIVFVLSACGAPVPTAAPATTIPPTVIPATVAPPTKVPATQFSAIDTPSIQIPSSNKSDCIRASAKFTLPHDAHTVGGKELYDLAKTEPSDLYLSVSAIVTEAQNLNLLSPSDSLHGTHIYAHIDEIDGVNISQYFLIIFLPTPGGIEDEIPAGSRISASGLYVGYVYPPKNLFTAFPNENQDTKFPSIKAEVATYGCP